MSKVSNRTKIATALVGALALAGSNFVVADPLADVQKADSSLNAASAASQQKVDKYFDQAQDMLFEYGSVADERESLKSYNDYVAGLVADQQNSLDLIQTDINGVDKLRQGVVPLMFKMVDALEQFVNLDLPFNIETRSFVSVHTGKLNLDGKEVLVDFFNLGRVALYAQSLDQKIAWMYDADAKSWNKLDDSYLRDITKGIRIARKQGALDLFALPIPAAETAQ